VAWEVVCQPGVVSSVSIDAGDGKDSVSNGSVLARVTLLGGANNDEISGGAASENLAGAGGNDTIQGGDGADVIDGGDGADELIGADGDDTITGGTGDDRLDGSDGSPVATRVGARSGIRLKPITSDIAAQSRDPHAARCACAARRQAHAPLRASP
jgi:hypothetical protein